MADKILWVQFQNFRQQVGAWKALNSSKELRLYPLQKNLSAPVGKKKRPSYESIERTHTREKIQSNKPTLVTVLELPVENK